MRWALGIIYILVILSMSYISIADCIPTGPEVFDNAIDEDCDGWFNFTNYTIRSTRPRLMLTVDNLDLIRNRVNSTHQVEYEEIRDSCEDYISGSQSMRPWRAYCCSFVYQVNKDGMIPGIVHNYNLSDYAQAAREMVIYYSNQSMNNGDFQDWVYAYDWIFENISSNHTLMTKIHKSLIMNVWGYDGYGEDSMRHDFQSYYAGDSLSTFWALTTLGDNEILDMDIWSYGYDKATLDEHFNTSDEVALHYIDTMLYNFNQSADYPVSWIGLIDAENLAASDDGGYPEGSFYEFGYNEGFYKFFTIWKSATDDTKAIEENMRFKYDPQWWLYMAREYSYSPWRYQESFNDGRAYVANTGGLTAWYEPPSMRPALYSQIHFFTEQSLDDEASLAKWILDDRVSKRVNTTWSYLSAIVYFNKSVDEKSPDELNLPLSKVFGGPDDTYDGHKAGMGYLIMRTSWNESNVVHAGFKSMPWYYSGHIHANDGTFFINYGEDLALTTSGSYENGDDYFQEREYFRRSISANNLLIYNESEVYRGIYTSTAVNDGGQYRQGQISRYYRVNDSMGQARDGLDKAEVQSKYDYASTNLTKQYNINHYDEDSGKVNEYFRHFIWLKSDDQSEPDVGNYFIVYDDVNTTSDEFEFKWLLHLQGEPLIDNEYTNISGHYGHVQEYTSPTYVSSTIRGSRLYMKPIFPDVNIRKVGGGLEHIPSANLGNYDNYDITTRIIVNITQPHTFGLDDAKAFRIGETGTTLTITDTELVLSGATNLTLSFTDYPTVQDIIDELYTESNEGTFYVKTVGSYGLALYNYTLASLRSGWGELRDHGGYWRIEAMPKEQSSYHTFLNVMVPTKTPGIIIDNDDSRCNLVGSDFHGETDQQGLFKFYGPDYNYLEPGASGDYAEYNFTALNTGEHNVYYTVPTTEDYGLSWPGRNVTYSILSDDGTTKIHVDQYKSKGNWKLLGKFNYTSGQEYNIRMDQDANYDILIDAVRIEPVGVYEQVNLPDMVNVTSSRGDYMEGVHVKNISIESNKLVMFAKNPINQTTYVIDGEGSLNHMLVGMYEDTQYRIYDNGVNTQNITSSSEGILFFTTNLGSIHTFSVSLGAVIGPYHDADTNEDGNIDSSEIRGYMSLWKTGVITISEMVDAISTWKD